MKLNLIGHFEMQSNQALVSDPCHPLMNQCQVHLVPTEPGLWEAYTATFENEDRHGERVPMLLAIHQDIHQYIDEVWLEDEYQDVGVDSGVAGIYDCHAFPHSKNAEGRYVEDQDWYMNAYEVTKCPDHAGIIRGGVVSSTGIGDGDFACYTFRHKFMILGIMLDFDWCDYTFDVTEVYHAIRSMSNPSNESLEEYDDGFDDDYDNDDDDDDDDDYDDDDDCDDD